MATDPAGIPRDSIEAASMRVTRLFFLGQIQELDLAGCGDLPWVSQMRACVDRLESQLGDDAQPVGRAGPLRAVK